MGESLFGTMADFTCPICKGKEEATIDHIVPQSFMKFIDPKDKLVHEVVIKTLRDNRNLRNICQRCNGKKGQYLDWNSPVTMEFLEKLLVRIKMIKANEKSLIPPTGSSTS